MSQRSRIRRPRFWQSPLTRSRNAAPAVRNFQPCLEPLERRDLLTVVAGIFGGRLEVFDARTGFDTIVESNKVTLSMVQDAGNDFVRVFDPRGVQNAGGGVVINANTVDFNVTSLTGTKRVYADLQEGDDDLTVDGGLVISTGGVIRLDAFGGGPAATDTLRMLGSPLRQETVEIIRDQGESGGNAQSDEQDIDGFGGRIAVSGMEIIEFYGGPRDPNAVDTLIVHLDQGPATARVQNSPRSNGGANNPPDRSWDEIISDVLPKIEFAGLGTFQIGDVGGDLEPVEVTFATNELEGAAHYNFVSSAQDTVIIEGTDGQDDNYTVRSLGPAQLSVTDNNPFLQNPVTVNAIGTFSRESGDRLQINTRGGDDLVTVDLTGTDLIDAPITYDGGSGSDRLVVQGTPEVAVTSVTYTPGPELNKGRLVYTAIQDEMLIDFVGLEPVVDLVPAAQLVVNGTAVANAINYEVGSAATRGLVLVDDFESIEFSAKTALVINGLEEGDHVTLDNAAVPTGLQTITVNGGGGNDTVNLLNLPDAAATTFLAATVFGGSGDDVIDGSGIAVQTPLSLHGGDGNDVLIGGAFNDQVFGDAGDDLLVYSPGNDAYDGAAGIDTMLVGGTSLNDVITINQTDAITLVINQLLAGSLVAQTSTHTVRGLEIVRVEGGDGDDVVAISVADALITPGPPDVDAGSLAFRVVGGGPNASDRLNVRDDGQGDLVVHRQAADGRSGSIRVGPLKPVDYEGIEFVDITPLDSVSGRTGNDGAGVPNGRLIVFRQDALESNATRLVATPLGGVPRFLPDLNIDPGPVTLPQPFDPLPGDEDWFEFRPPKIGTYRFETLFQKIPTLPSGRQGLPGDGNLQIEVRGPTGTLISSLANAADNKSLAISMAANTSYFLRVRGVDTAINVYDLNITEVDLLGPQVFDPDGAGGLNGVHVTDDPATPVNEALFDLFAQKNATGVTTPTPAIKSLTIHLRDPLSSTLLVRQPGDVYPALDAVAAAQPGLYVLVGDHVGRIPISSVIVTNDPPVAGQVATATVELRFAQALPDDRYTLTILDGLVDPPGNRLDGESDSAEPETPPTLPSGNGISGGNFVMRFTVDTLPEIGFYAGKSVIIDMNGDGVYNPGPAEGFHNDMAFLFGEPSDQRFAGKFSRNHPGFDVLAAYGNVNGTYRFLIDFNGNGAVDAGEEIVSPPGAQVSAVAVAGNFDGNLNNGDEIALFDGTQWRVLASGLGSSGAPFDNGLRGYPLAGDFDGDGTDDLATFQNDVFSFGFGSIAFGAPGVSDRPVAADMDGDGIDDIGLWIPHSGTEQGTSEWRFLISHDPSKTLRVAGSLNTLAHPFSPTPLGADLAYHFGDPTALPIVGNFDPPASPQSATTSPPAQGGGSSSSGGGSTSQTSPAGGSGDQHAASQAVVASLYHDILGREADPSGLSYYTAQLDAGATRGTIAQALWASAERYGNVVDEFYATYLHRQADSNGRSFWVQALVHGATEDSVATSFMLSSEYASSHATNQAFVDALYGDVLGRAADAGGRASHMAALASGLSRADLVASFLSSTERSRRTVDQLYEQMFERHADLAGMEWYAARLRSGQYTTRTLAQIFAASDEYFAKLA